MPLDPERVRRDFAAVVNMSAAELRNWLRTDESKRVGFKPDGGESVGHASGRRIVTLLGKAEDRLSADDLLHMRKVVGFVRRHSAQQPENRVTSRWRYSLMNWGHDPLKSWPVEPVGAMAVVCPVRLKARKGRHEARLLRRH